MKRIQFSAVLVSVLLLTGCGKPQPAGVPNVSIFRSMDCVQAFVAHTNAVGSVALKLLTVQSNVPKGDHPQDTITVVLRDSAGNQVATATHKLTTGTNGWVVIPFSSEVDLIPDQKYALHVHDGHNGWFGWEFDDNPEGEGTFGAPESDHRVQFYYKLNPEETPTKPSTATE